MADHHSEGSVSLATPNFEIYGVFDFAFARFNRDLFGNTLSRPVITLSRKGRRTTGFLRAERFQRVGSDQTTCEIALSPSEFSHPLTEVMANLVHQMVHLWQVLYGAPSRAGYHNSEWAQRMTAVGLRPTSDGTSSGKATGQSVSQSLIPGSPFDHSLQNLIAGGFEIAWREALEATDDKDQKLGSEASGRVKWHCPECRQSALAKASAELACSKCKVALVRHSSSANAGLRRVPVVLGGSSGRNLSL